MTAMELNQSLLQEITYISDDENMMRKVLNYVRKLRRKEEETEYITKEEVLAGIDAGLKEMKLAKEGKIELCSAWDFLNELKNE